MTDDALPPSPVVLQAKSVAATADFGADRALCFRHLPILDAIATRRLAEISNREPRITPDDVAFVTELAAEIRAAAAERARDGLPSADILPFSPYAIS